MSETLARVEAPHFVAGFVVAEGRCIKAAPIIRYFVGKPSDWIRDYCRQKKWKAITVPALPGATG